MPKRTLTVEISETLWRETEENLKEDIGMFTGAITDKIIKALGLDTIDPTLRHFGTPTLTLSTRTIEYMHVEFDSDDVTDFSHTDEVRMKYDDIRKKIVPLGLIPGFKVSPTDKERRDQRRLERQQNNSQN